jgi:hypothetical protein
MNFIGNFLNIFYFRVVSVAKLKNIIVFAFTCFTLFKGNVCMDL